MAAFVRSYLTSIRRASDAGRKVIKIRIFHDSVERRAGGMMRSFVITSLLTVSVKMFANQLVQACGYDTRRLTFYGLQCDCAVTTANNGNC